MRTNGLFHGFTFTEDELGADGLCERVNTGVVGDCGNLGEVGEPGGRGAFLGDSNDVSMCGGVRLDGSMVRIEAPSSSSISNNVVRSE